MAVTCRGEMTKPRTISELDATDFFSDFDSGSLLGLTKTGPGEFAFELQSREVHGPQGSLMVWFYGGCDLSGFRVNGGDRLRFLIRNPHSLSKMRPVYSSDGETWDYVPEPYGPDDQGYRFQLPLSQSDRVYFAAHFPYPSSRTFDLVQRAAGHRSLTASTIGSTELGRPIPILTVAAAQKAERRVLLSAGSHAGETASLWGMEGIIDFLLSDAPEASAILNQVAVTIVPMLNVDGAALGLDRRQATGVNIYFDYQDFAACESRLMWSLVESLRPDLWLDLHSWHLGIAEGAYGPDPNIIGEDTFNSKVKPVLDSVGKRFPISQLGLDTLDCPNTQALLRLGVPGILVEFNMGKGADGRWKSIHDNKALGVDMLRGVDDYLCLTSPAAS